VLEGYLYKNALRVDKAVKCNYNVPTYKAGIGMKVAIVRIGNSKGIRLPKAVLEQCALGDEADLEVQDGQVVIRSTRRPRIGWESSFAAMHNAGDDALLDTEAHQETAWDAREWRW